MENSAAAVSCQKVVKVYDTGGQKVTALNGVDLEIKMENITQNKKGAINSLFFLIFIFTMAIFCI